MKRNQCMGILVLLFTGCGGGGSDPVTVFDFNGRWSGGLALVSDQCHLSVNPLNEIHTVTVMGDTVELVSTDGRTLEGSLSEEPGFEVSISDGAPFPTIDRVSYAALSEGRAYVIVSHSFSRPGGCVTEWAGEMVRFMPARRGAASVTAASARGDF